MSPVIFTGIVNVWTCFQGTFCSRSSALYISYAFLEHSVSNVIGVFTGCQEGIVRAISIYTSMIHRFFFFSSSKNCGAE